MVHHAKQIRQELLQAVDSVASNPKQWLKSPTTDFTRNRVLTFKQVLLCLLKLEGKSLGSELLEHFNFSLNAPTVSAFCQARNKISSEALLAVFKQFQSSTAHKATYHGYQLLAHDGSELKLPLNPQDKGTYIEQGKQSCNLIHLNALYDLLNRNFEQVSIEDKHDYDERRSLIAMAEQLKVPSIFIADRGYRSLNVYEHLKKAGHYFVIRESDTTAKNGILHSFRLPEDEAFDRMIQFHLSRRQTNEVKADHWTRWLSPLSKFDYLTPKEKASYPMRLRVVRFKIGEESYESLVTNLPSTQFSTADLKQLYHLRWGIETAFRELKYALGMNWFHARKKELIKQEIYARLILYNFSMRIAMQVKLKAKSTQYVYQINYTQAFGICRAYLKHSRCAVEALIQKFILPVRSNRVDPRKLKNKPFVGFLYRVA